MLARALQHLDRETVRRALGGAAVAIVGTGALTAVMFLLRPHLAVATTALVLVIPVVLAVVVGGVLAGVLAVVLGFLAYDFVFIPPYGTLNVGAAQNWAALAVYVVVMLVVTRVVDRLQSARLQIAAQAAATRRLFELSDLLIAAKPLPALLESVVETVRATFGYTSVVLLLAEHEPGSTLRAAAIAGEPLSAVDLAVATPSGGAVSSLVSTSTSARGDATAHALVTVPLVATGRPVGALVVRGAALDATGRALLHVYANQAALAVERARLNEQALRTELLEQADRWRSALIGAVSHDLRTPLASVKAAVSDLRRADVPLSAADRDELLGLVEGQTDRLGRLVTNLLDMTRIHSGALVARRSPVAVEELLAEALEALAGTGIAQRLARDLEPGLPLVDVDHALIAQALANLLENALLHTPEGGRITVTAQRAGAAVRVGVSDEGPGVPAAEREKIFLMFSRISGAGRAGLGLAIVRAFVEAHGETVAVGDAPGGGAVFSFTVPVAQLPDVPPEDQGPSTVRAGGEA